MIGLIFVRIENKFFLDIFTAYSTPFIDARIDNCVFHDPPLNMIPSDAMLRRYAYYTIKKGLPARGA
jgi:hypothetical protein